MPRLVVFYFSATWCQPCHLMAPKYAELANSPVPGLNTGSSEVQFNLLEQKFIYSDWHHYILTSGDIQWHVERRVFAFLETKACIGSIRATATCFRSPLLRNLSILTSSQWTSMKLRTPSAISCICTLIIADLFFGLRLLDTIG